MYKNVGNGYIKYFCHKNRINEFQVIRLTGGGIKLKIREEDGDRKNLILQALNLWFTRVIVSRFLSISQAFDSMLRRNYKFASKKRY